MVGMLGRLSGLAVTWVRGDGHDETEEPDEESRGPEPTLSALTSTGGRVGCRGREASPKATPWPAGTMPARWRVASG
eukprot:15441062-Alexandrium_andersonii.AAC.1